jgi:MoxR-like ATPase
VTDLNLFPSYPHSWKATMTTDTIAPARQVEPAEHVWAAELDFLAAYDAGPRPTGWRLTPRAVVTFICGSDGEALALPSAAKGAGRSAGAGATPVKLVIARKFVGDRDLVERCVVTLAGERGLLLVGEPGTAKSMLSELLAAAVSGDSTRVVQGTAGSTEDQLKYGWNYALLLAEGPSEQALVPSPVMAAMRVGAVARVEEITRCLPEVQDALVSVLSDRRISVPELSGERDGAVYAAPGFTVIATANLRDRGVSEMSAALKRRFNFETIGPIGSLAAEVSLVRDQAKAALARVDAPYAADDAVLEVLVTAFRDLRNGRSVEGWDVERPSTVMSTAEAVSVTTSLALSAAYFPGGRDPLDLVPGHLIGVVRKDDPADADRLLAYWDGAVRKRAQEDAAAKSWRRLWELRDVLGG